MGFFVLAQVCNESMILGVLQWESVYVQFRDLNTPICHLSQAVPSASWKWSDHT